MKRSAMPPRKVPMRRGSVALDRVPIQRSQRINPRSKAMKVVYEERRALVAELLAKYPTCRMRPGCNRMTTCLHEKWKRGRSGQTAHAILCRANCVPSCSECNQWVDDHNDEATGLGLAIPSWVGCPCGQVK